jgi:hypothetical protein
VRQKTQNFSLENKKAAARVVGVTNLKRRSRKIAIAVSRRLLTQEIVSPKSWNPKALATWFEDVIEKQLLKGTHEDSGV